MLRNLVRWARITKSGMDDKQFAIQQMGYLGKVADGLMVFPYGIHGNVPVDALALMFAVEGNPDNRAAIAWTPKDRPKLAAGEVAFYHPPTGGSMIWRANGDLDIQTGNNGTANINIKAAKINVIGETHLDSVVTSNDVDISHTHVHAQGNDDDGDVEVDTDGPKSP